MFAYNEYQKDYYDKISMKNCKLYKANDGNWMDEVKKKLTCVVLLYGQTVQSFYLLMVLWP